MRSNEIALINYYARLIRKGSYKIEDVPEDIRTKVIEAKDKLGDMELDPVTQTPEEK